MKHFRLHSSLLLVLVFCGLPTLAQDQKDSDPQPEEDTFLGEWYVQLMEDEVLPADEPIRLVFEKSGLVRVFEGDEEEQAMAYTYDEAKSTITIVEQDDPADIEAIIKYSFVDDMLVMRISEGQGGDEEEVIELTRNAEGTKRHQKLRKDRGDQPSRRKQMQRMMQMRQLYMGAMTYQADHDKMPESLGDIVVGGYIGWDTALAKSEQEKLPKDFDDWKEPAKRDWINQHAGCVYIKVDLNDPQIDSSKQIAIIEVPASKEQEHVNLVFADGHAETQAYKEADREVSKQTGHTLEKWMKTTTPGSGKMVLPEKKDKADE